VILPVLPISLEPYEDWVPFACISSQSISMEDERGDTIFMWWPGCRMIYIEPKAAEAMRCAVVG
jgi:hypothetical protein